MTGKGLPPALATLPHQLSPLQPSPAREKPSANYNTRLHRPALLHIHGGIFRKSNNLFVKNIARKINNSFQFMCSIIMILIFEIILRSKNHIFGERVCFPRLTLRPAPLTHSSTLNVKICILGWGSPESVVTLFQFTF